MRNLRNVRRSFIRFRDQEPRLTGLTWDTSTEDSAICVFGPTVSSALVELKRINTFVDNEHQLIASWEAPSPSPDLPSDQILDLHYFADTAVACLVFLGGDIVVIREQPLPGEELLEIVGSVDAGISAAAWSPDEELLAICTNDEKFLLMSRDFEPVADVSFSRDDAKLSKHVSVGWGKVETQFKGKRAKALRDPTMPEKVEEGLLSLHDAGQVSVSWRGDGAFVAVNSIEVKTRRMIRVYSRDGVLDSVSEPVDFLEGALSWRPAGNLIAGVQRLERETRVVFFERNGLRHGQFDLRLSPEEMNKFGSPIDLKWNVDSTVLAIIFKDRVRLWTMGNYHYYQKQEILCEKPDVQPRLCWHPELPLRLGIFGRGGIYSRDYAFAVSRGPTESPCDEGLVVVIDGKTIRITPLRSANVPPPMALHELQLDSNAIDVACSSSGRYLAVLVDHCVKVFDVDDIRCGTTEPIDTIEFEGERRPPLQAAFSTDADLFILFHSEEGNREVVYHISLESKSQTKRTGYKEISPTTGNRVAILIPGQTIPSILLEDNYGNVIEIQDDVIQDQRQVSKLPLSCPLTEVLQHHSSIIAFGLLSSGSLFANSRRLTPNCTSFLLTSSHLIFTTSNHLLKFVHLTDADNLEVPADEPEIDERCRSIERGAKLVTVMPSAYSLVLQMPRGNLETIYPRALVLAAIRKNIKEKDYKKAFMSCRSQRVDMNILYDYSPQQLLDNVKLFIKQIKKVEYIDLFLSQLREADTAQTIYKETRSEEESRVPNGYTHSNGKPSREAVLSARSKVNAICDAFLRVLSSRLDTNLQNIITAHVCKSPPDLEGGLKIIAQLRIESNELAERAAEHICFLADPNQLYDHALGIYDLELVVLIAQQSQKDPREYLPYLQGLQEMEPLRRQFIIDNDLGKKAKALQHLHALDAFDELKRYTGKYELYGAAIELCKHQPERLNSLMRLYAEYLNSRNRFKDAGIAYEYLQDYASAIPAYRSANLWHEALACASLLPLPQNELTSLARDLADGLTESKDFQGAAIIHLDYLSDIESAAKLFCKAYLFADAMRIVSLKGRPKLLTEVIDQGLIECFNSTTELLADCKEQLAAQVPRLQELRLKKEQDPLAFYGGEATGGAEGDVPDDISLAATDASTTGTFMTKYTKRSDGTLASNVSRRTSKNRRREERKRARGKKGSVYEEEYLVNSIGRLIERINDVGDEVRRLVEALMRREMRERAVNVESTMAGVVGRCQDVVPVVWRRGNEKGREEKDDINEPGGISLEGAAGTTPTQLPVVKVFEKLSLLG